MSLMTFQRFQHNNKMKNPAGILIFLLSMENIYTIMLQGRQIYFKYFKHHKLIS